MRRPPTPSTPKASCRRRVVAALCAALVGLLSCQDDEPQWIQELEHAHQSADGARSEEQRAQAAKQLEAAYRTLPATSSEALIFARQDLCARLAELSFERGEPEAALRWATKGLGLSERLNVARAELLRLKGNALEAMGDKPGAVEALHEALKANQALMERALEGKTLDQETP